MTSAISPPPAPGPLPLLYLDDVCVVVDKPSGLLVHRGWGNDEDVAMFRVRDQLGSWVYPVHRLDRGTSGVLLFGRTPSAAAALGAQLAAKRFNKRYLALVRGVPAPEGVIDYPVRKGEVGDERVPAVTHFRLVQRSPVDRCALVEAVPETGRLHQIRRHLRHLSHPILGDVVYGNGATNRHYRAVYGLHRLALHAYSLGFDHPTSGARLEVRAELAPELATVLTALELPCAFPAVVQEKKDEPA